MANPVAAADRLAEPGAVEQGLAFFERMQRIRRFEDRVQSLFLRGEVHGTTHLYSGEEAGAVGVCAALGAGRPRRRHLPRPRPRARARRRRRRP